MWPAQPSRVITLLLGSWAAHDILLQPITDKCVHSSRFLIAPVTDVCITLSYKTVVNLLSYGPLWFGINVGNSSKQCSFQNRVILMEAAI